MFQPILVNHGSLNVPIEHHPTMNGIWSTKWLLFRVMSFIFPKWDIYQPLLTILKNISQMGLLFRISGKIKKYISPNGIRWDLLWD